LERKIVEKAKFEILFFEIFIPIQIRDPDEKTGFISTTLAFIRFPVKEFVTVL